MTDDLTSLASAYLDGEATAEEIAGVVGDPEALAEVERLRQVRAVVGDIDPPVISAREAHLATALGTWDRLPEAERNGSQRGAAATGIDPITAAAAAAISAPPPRERRGSMSTGWILAAAASLVVLLAGGLTLRSLTGDEGSDAATEADQQTAAVATLASDAATTDPSLEPSEDISDTDTEADASADGAPPPEEGLEELSDPDQLAVYGSDAIDDDGNIIEGTGDAPPVGEAPPVEDVAPRETASTVAAPDSPSTDFPLCAGADFVVGPAVYQGTVVVVAIDSDNDLVIAYLPSNCAVIAQAPLP